MNKKGAEWGFEEIAKIILILIVLVILLLLVYFFKDKALNLVEKIKDIFSSKV